MKDDVEAMNRKLEKEKINLNEMKKEKSMNNKYQLSKKDSGLSS